MTYTDNSSRIGLASSMNGFIIDIMVNMNSSEATESTYWEKVLALYKRIVG